MKKLLATLLSAVLLLSLALCLTEGLLSGKGCAWRVHGGGFAGTIQAYVKAEYEEAYAK